MDLYQHVLPEMDETAAATVATLIGRSRRMILTMAE
jgi:hypothetical protein